MALSPYLRLMRLHQPVGVWLLLWPCGWSLALASHGLPPPGLLLLFALGALLMRSAGCIINDLADREFDRQVERTKNRPLASGELTARHACLLLAALLAAAACVAFALGPAVMLWAALSLIPVAIYPFMKRLSWWPQLFLGLTFNWGALMGWAAIHESVDPPALLLYAGCVLWTLGYDTLYAHQDKADDARLGLRSTALRLGNHTRRAVKTFYMLAVVFWAAAGFLTGAGMPIYLALSLAILQFGWQTRRVDLDDPASCRRMFVSNAWLGALIFAGFALA